MAIRSMTGFGRATVAIWGVSHTIEVRSVNHRYLDLKVRLPRGLGSLEALIRRRVGALTQRGRVEVTVTSGVDDADAFGALQINHRLAAELYAAHLALAEAHQVPLALDSLSLAAFPGVLERVVQDRPVADLEAVFTPGLEAALEALDAMRIREGAALQGALHGHVDGLEAYRARLEAGAPAQVEAYRERLLRRLRDWLAAVDVAVDPARVVHEVALFAEKTDVTEELARLSMHLRQCRELLDTDAEQAVGRRLDFLCQEILREVNTTGSKVQDIELTEGVVGMKAELERLREQVQNVE